MSTRRILLTAIPLVLLCLLLAPEGVMAKGKPGGGGGKPPPDENCPGRHIWANTPNLYETASTEDPIALPDSGEVTVARFQIDDSDRLRGTVTVDGFEFTLLEGDPGGVTFRVYYLSCGSNCYAREVYHPSDFTLYGSATPDTEIFTIDNEGVEHDHDLLGSHFCVYVTAEDVSAAVDTYQLSVDYSYTKGTSKKALNADCKKYETYGLSNDKSFYRNDAEGPAPALEFVEFVVE